MNSQIKDSEFEFYSLSFSRIYFECTIFFTLNSLSSLRIHCQFTMFSRTHFQCFILISLSWRIQFKITLFFANSIQIHYLKTLSVSRNHLIFIMFFANSIRIHYLFHEITLNFYFLRDFNLNALFILRIRIDSTICFANPL